MAHAGPLVLRALCEENSGCNNFAPGPTSSAPFPPTIISVVIILKGQLILKHPKLVCKPTQILYLSYILKHQFFSTLFIYYTFFNTESYLSIYRVTNIFMPKFTLILINLKYILYFIIQLQ